MGIIIPTDELIFLGRGRYSTNHGPSKFADHWKIRKSWDDLPNAEDVIGIWAKEKWGVSSVQYN